MSRGRNWTGTLNNPKVTLEEWVATLMRLPGATAARAQLERGEQTRTPHFQWVVCTSVLSRHKKICGLLTGAHVELAHHALAAWNYCGKEKGRIEGPVEQGIPPAARNIKGDTAARNKMILEKGLVAATDEGLVPIEKFKMVKQSIDLYKIMKKDVQNLDVLDNEWHWGRTGTGKSRSVRTRYPDAFIKSGDLWWDGYDGEEVVIIEELGPRMIGAQHIKQWTDYWKFKANVKGSYNEIRPKKIIVTSNYSIQDVYGDERDYEAIERRFKITHYP